MKPLNGESVKSSVKISLSRFHTCKADPRLPILQVTESLDHPLHLSSIRIVNPPKTSRPGFLNSLLSPFISPIPQSNITPSWLNPSVAYGLEGSTPPSTLHEILYTTKMLTTHLRRFDIFQDQIDVKLEPAKGGVIGDVDLVLGIREKGRVFLKAGTEVGGGEGGFVS